MRRFLRDPLFQGGCMGLAMVLACLAGLTAGELMRGMPVAAIWSVAP